MQQRSAAQHMAVHARACTRSMHARTRARCSCTHTCAQVWIQPGFGLADDYLAALEGLSNNNPEATIILILGIFAVVHSGLAGLRPYGARARTADVAKRACMRPHARTRAHSRTRTRSGEGHWGARLPRHLCVRQPAAGHCRHRVLHQPPVRGRAHHGMRTVACAQHCSAMHAHAHCVPAHAHCVPASARDAGTTARPCGTCGAWLVCTSWCGP